MNDLIKKICQNTYNIYKSRLEKEKLKVDIGMKPIIFKVLEKNNFNVHFINITEKLKKDTNKKAQKNDFLNFMAKYNIDALSVSDKGILWSVFTHTVIPTKKNNKQIYLSFAGRNIIKKNYGKMPVDKFIKSLFSMQFSNGKTLFIDSTERFKKVEKKLLDGLFFASNIPSFYVEKDNNIYFCNKKEFLPLLFNVNPNDIKILLIKEINEIHNLFKQYLHKLYGPENWKRIEVTGTFLNSYLNLKDISNMIEGPNDILQEWLRKMGVAYDDSYIKRIVIDDIITDKRLEGFFLYYKNLKKKENILEKINL